MNNLVKRLCLILALATLILCIANAVPSAKAAGSDSDSDSDYEAFRLKSEHMLYPSHYYSTVEMTDIPKEHTFIKIASGYPDFGCDNRNNSALCSKPYKFSELYDYYVANGSTGKVVIPCCVLDLALGGDPVEVAGFGMTLRSHFDCRPIHLKIQVATDADAKNWITVYDATNIEWESISKRWYFDPVNAYQIRVVALDIDEVDKAEEGDYYDPIQGDETRFTYAEVDVYTLRQGDTTTPTTPSKNPTASTESATRPAFNFPAATTKPTTPAATTKPTTAATAKPTTPAATTAPTTPIATVAPTTPIATVNPTTVVTEPVATEAATVVTTPSETLPVDTTEPTVDAVIDPDASTEETVDPSAPTEEIVEPSTPTEAVPTEPEVTEGAVPEASEPLATVPSTDTTVEEKPDNTAIIIVAVVAAAAVIGGAVFFIIKKKKQS